MINNRTLIQTATQSGVTSHAVEELLGTEVQIAKRSELHTFAVIR